jgi:hypothetical protein
VHETTQAAATRFVYVSKRYSDTGYPQSFAQTVEPQQDLQEVEAAPSNSNASDAMDVSSTSNQLQHEEQQQQRRSQITELPPEVLRVPLAQETKQEKAEVTVDAYSLSRLALFRLNWSASSSLLLLLPDGARIVVFDRVSATLCSYVTQYDIEHEQQAVADSTTCVAWPVYLLMPLDDAASC